MAEASRLLSNFGPAAGPLLHRDCPGTLGVYRPGSAMPCGAAHPLGWVPTRQGPAAVFRLAAEGVDPEARFLCVAREFVELGDAAG